MNPKPPAIMLAVLLTVAGGAAAVTSTGPTSVAADDDAAHDADVAATYDDGTVMVTVTNAGEPVENVTVEVTDGEYRTDENGMVTVEDVDGEGDLNVEVEGDGFEAELEYVVEDGELVLGEEAYNYEDEGADEDERESDDADEDEDDEADEAGEDGDDGHDDDDSEEYEDGEYEVPDGEPEPIEENHDDDDTYSADQES